jgi:hypothetical protein
VFCEFCRSSLPSLRLRLRVVPLFGHHRYLFHDPQQRSPSSHSNVEHTDRVRNRALMFEKTQVMSSGASPGLGSIRVLNAVQTGLRTASSTRS